MQGFGNGLDEQGFIQNVYSPEYIQPEFQSVVESVVNELRRRLPNQIDGIYLYGSVPRGNAVLGKSDLDLSLVLKRPIIESDREVFKYISLSLPQSHPEISKLDIDPGCVGEVMQPQEIYHWQFWLKHCCCFIWGNDLSQQFPRQRPSIEIANALNGDLLEFRDQIEGRMEAMHADEVSKVIGKKLLRAAYYFVAEKDGSWYTDLGQCYQVAARYYPHLSDELKMTYELASGYYSSKEDAIQLLEQLSQKLTS
ncbi:nucleotidyltransferase domain-containing protein [Photobacterium atrarenae]|uniref:Nucleotidyltransferase domain-containing protein n=1 Tax=Photobacterium atrarenae TaxID=865757 RepID=A0ABY5GLE2_9GAMM|nr:nucleotidyltransferase domain-containing protein [Photobacterium atrarenae]UTV29956.1 nucleotidyltransferase domain-containing protein [Photobacterium atrarenae]